MQRSPKAFLWKDLSRVFSHRGSFVEKPTHRSFGDRKTPNPLYHRKKNSCGTYMERKYPKEDLLKVKYILKVLYSCENPKDIPYLEDIPYVNAELYIEILLRTNRDFLRPYLQSLPSSIPHSDNVFVMSENKNFEESTNDKIAHVCPSETK